MGVQVKLILALVYYVDLELGLQLELEVVQTVWLVLITLILEALPLELALLVETVNGLLKGLEAAILAELELITEVLEVLLLVIV